MSMSPLHGAVLGAAAVVSSPALWLTMVDGTLPLGDALTRYLISVVLCWVALNAVAQLVAPQGAGRTTSPQPSPQSSSQEGTEAPHQVPGAEASQG